MADTDEELRQLKKELEELKAGKATEEKKSDSGNELLQFFLGFLLFGGGVFWALNSFTVTSTWGSGYWGLFGMRLPAGVMLIPLLIGIALLFFMKKKIVGGMVSALGILIILISLLTSLQFHAVRGSLYVYVLMFGMIAAGAGLLVRVLFKKR